MWGSFAHAGTLSHCRHIWGWVWMCPSVTGRLGWAPNQSIDIWDSEINQLTNGTFKQILKCSLSLWSVPLPSWLNVQYNQNTVTHVICVCDFKPFVGHLNFEYRTNLPQENKNNLEVHVLHNKRSVRTVLAELKMEVHDNPLWGSVVCFYCGGYNVVYSTGHAWLFSYIERWIFLLACADFFHQWQCGD